MIKKVMMMVKKVALVTGGTSGIGLATTKKFIKEGFQVVAVGLNEDQFSKLKEQINSDDVEFKKVNVADRDQIKQLVQSVRDEYGRIDVMVNSAGILAKEVDLVDADLDNIENTIQVNLMGTIYVDKYVAQVMKEQGFGTIVNIGSIDGVIANHESIAYHASKGGVHMVTKALAREMAPYGVRVVCVAPGWVETAMTPPKAKNYGEKLMMKHRLISPEELAGAVYLMTLPDASAINGSVVMADDGYASFKGMGILNL